MDNKNLLVESSIPLLEKEFFNATQNQDLEKAVYIFQKLYELGFGGTNWRNEFDFQE